MFVLLAHPICLCLAMIVYAVHVSKNVVGVSCKT